MSTIQVKFIRTSIGNDPEFFYMSKRNTPIAAEKFLPPKPATRTPNGSIYFDNTSVEFDIPPRSCLMELNHQISSKVQALSSILSSKKLPVSSLRTSFRSAEKISKTTLNKYQSVRLFACRPSLFLEGDNHTIRHPEVDPFQELRRSAGFHVHIGSPQSPHFEKLVTYAIKLCDLLVGIPAVFLDRDTERVQWRRQVIGYGVAGEFRIQPWGYEYRTLGSWPLSHPFWAWWANSSVRMANSIAEFLLGFGRKSDLFNIDRTAVERTINSNNFNDAKAIWMDVKKILQNEFDLDVYSHNLGSTFLSVRNTAAIEFMIKNGGLELTNGKFFESWLQPAKYKTYSHLPFESSYSGIQNITKKMLEPIGFEKFFRSYRFNNDNIL